MNANYVDNPLVILGVFIFLIGVFLFVFGRKWFLFRLLLGDLSDVLWNYPIYHRINTLIYVWKV